MYAIIGGVLVTAASVFAYYYYDHHGANDHGHGQVTSPTSPSTQPVAPTNNHGHSHNSKGGH